MKIGVYGGTFDPPHLGHMEAAKAACSALGLEKLLFVPAAQPPHKDLARDSAGGEHRLAMTELMADGLCLALGRPAAAVDRVEFDRPGPSYTADTLAALRERYPEDELWLLMGTDMLLTFPQWREPERIAALVGLCAFSRRDGEEYELRAQAAVLEERYGAHTAVISLEKPVDVSSSRLRGVLAEAPQRARDDLWCPVYGYILRQGLYGTHVDLKRLDDEDLRRVSWSMVKAKRIPHIRGTEEEAVRLAVHWGEDPEQARRAGILHDCTKYLDLTQQLHLCQKYDIVLDQLERETVKLLHAKTGAALARHLFGVSDEIYWAIYWHTTGKADMSPLEKILYLADYIEPSRQDFPGLDRLRQLAYEDMDAALLMGCELTIEDMVRRGNLVHRNTQQARDYLKGRME